MRKMNVAIAALALVVGLGSAVAAESPRAQSAPNNNALRPGAGAPNCAKLVETSDKCVFHTRKGQVDTVRLPMANGVTWKATVSDAALVAVGETKVETLPDGSRQQVVQVVPQTSADADVILKLEKKSSTDSAAPATETRTINLMIHALTPASTN